MSFFSRNIARSSAVFLALIFLSLGTLAQTSSGTVRGLILDSSTGRPVSDAVIILLQNETILDRTRSGPDGTYNFLNVEEGLFAVQVDIKGYLDAIEADVRIVPGRVTRMDFQMVRRPPDLEEIRVTTKAVGTAQSSSAIATRLDREEIRRGAGTAGDVFRGLDILPGVANTGEFSNFTVRGRGPRDNLILVDGIPFDKVVHFDRTLGEEEDIGGGGRFAIFAPNLIGSAEFQPGGWQAAYSGRNGSLLRLNIAEGNPYTPSVSGRVDIAGGELTYDGPSYLLDNTSLLLSARYFDFGNVFKIIDQKDIGDPEVADIIFKSVTEISDKHNLSLIALYSPEDFVRDIDNVLESENFEDVALLTSEQDSLLLGATWRWLVGYQGQATNAVFFRDSDKYSQQGEAFPDLLGFRPLSEELLLRRDILSVSENEQEIGWRGDFTTRTPLGLFSMGARYSLVRMNFTTLLDGNWIRYVYDQDDFRPNSSQKFIVLTPDRINADFNAKKSRSSAYIDHTFFFGPLSFNPGIRFDRDGFSGQSLLSPRLMFSWQLSDRTRVSATGGVYYQTPRFLDLAADGNNNLLKNEKSSQVSLGVEHYPIADLKLAGEIYYQKLKDLVIFGDETSRLAFNTGEGHSTGIDISIQKLMSNDWSVSLAYSYSRSKRNENLGEGKHNADFHRPHLFNIAAVWQPNDRWAIAAKWKYASGRPTDMFIINEDIFNDPSYLRFSKEITVNNAERLRDFHVLNLRIDYRRRFGEISLVTFIDVINLYGRSNIDSLEFDERRGVNVFGDLNVFPQIGLKLEF